MVTFRLPAGYAAADLPLLAGEIEADAGTVTVRTPEPTRDVHTLTGWAAERGLDLSGLSLTRPTLEDVYLALTAEPADVG